MVECQLCHDYEGTVKGLCSHVSQVHGWKWQDYVTWYDIDTSEMNRQHSLNARRGWGVKQ